MTAPPLFNASVPVFRHYLDRIGGLLDKVEGREEVLVARLAPDMFTCSQQLATAINFSLRVAAPLAGIDVPADTGAGTDLAGLRARRHAADAFLAALDPAGFEVAAERRIRHRAGFAELEQSGADFLYLFGMPNFLFHTAMAFAVMRANGIEIGKADFDGLHDYPHGFRF
jgi:hypothetical protein